MEERDALKDWIEDCILLFEEKHGVKLDETAKQAFLFAFSEGIKVGEDSGFLL